MSTENIERGAEPKPRYIDINAFFASENVNNVYGDYWELKEKLEELPAADEWIGNILSQTTATAETDK